MTSQFARQNRDDPPPGVSQDSAWTSVVHYLSGSIHRTPLVTKPACRDSAPGVMPGRRSRKIIGFPETSALRTLSSRRVSTSPWSVFQDGSHRRALARSLEWTGQPQSGLVDQRAVMTTEALVSCAQTPLPPHVPKSLCGTAADVVLFRILFNAPLWHIQYDLVRYRNRDMISLGRASPVTLVCATCSKYLKEYICSHILAIALRKTR